MDFSGINFSVRALELTSPDCWGSWAQAGLSFGVTAAGFQCGPLDFFIPVPKSWIVEGNWRLS